MYKKALTIRKRVKKRVESKFGKAGFTLMELLVVLAILSMLALTSLIAFNSFNQLRKAQNAQILHDLQQIKIALDLYYNDHSCYPGEDTFTFGSPWTEGGTVYMKKVPASPTLKYIYVTDTAKQCPQWNVIFAKINSDVINNNITLCSLEKLSNCLPAGYSELGYNYCVTLGDVDCKAISSSTFITPTPTSTITPTPTPTLTPTITPTSAFTPTPTQSCSKDYSCTGGYPTRCNLVPKGTGQYCSNSCEGKCQSY